MRPHEEYQENIGAYLLGALTELEADVFERHLMGCESCRAEVEGLRVAAEVLPRTVTPMRPPPELRASLMQIVEDEAAAAAGGRSRRRWLRLPELPRWRPAMAWVSAALLLLVGVGVGLALNGVGGDDPRTVAASVDQARLPDASGSLIVASDDHGGVLRVQGLPAPPAGRVYQVWLMRGEELIPGALFVPRADGTGEAGIPDDLDGYDAVLVTREPAGGGRKPSEQPVLSVELS